MRKFIFLFLPMMFVYRLSIGFGMIVIDPSNLIQNTKTAVETSLIYAKNAEQVTNQLQMLKYKVTELQSTDFHSLSDITRSVDALRGAANIGSAITYSTADINKQFEKNFGSGNKEGNYADRMSQMLGTVLDTSRGTLNAAAKHADLLKGETDGLNDIVRHSDGAAGTKEVLQGTNQMLDALGAQMQSTKLAILQLQSQAATKDAMEAAKEQAAIDADKKFLDYKVNYQGYKADSRFKVIPSFN